MANLRIIYDNAVDRGTVTASSTAGVLSATNLYNDLKSQVWRSVGTTATLTVTWPTAEIINGIALPFCSLTSTATIRVRGYTDAGGTILSFDSGTILAAPYAPLGLWAWGAQALGVNAYSYGGGSYARVWPSGTITGALRKMVIDIVDSGSPLGYIEVSKIVAGSYWSPKYNTGYGIPANYRTNSVSSRNDAGDLITEISTKSKILTVDFSYLEATDRSTLNSIVRGNSTDKSIFVSIFPDDTDSSKEQLYQIYGRLSQLSAITYTNNIMYASQLDIEEI